MLTSIVNKAGDAVNSSSMYMVFDAFCIQFRNLILDTENAQELEDGKVSPLN